MSNGPRIVSLVPSATEIVYLLGLGENLVGRSHDSDFPHEVRQKPTISKAKISDNLSSLEIDRAVKQSMHRGVSLFHIDQKKLAKLRPDLVLTQELCPVCAPNFTQVKQACRIMDGQTNVVSLEPHSLADVFDNIQTVAEFAGVKDEARPVIARLEYRLEQVKNMVRNVHKPKVMVIEWLDPIMIAGHWVPEMVELAGGKILLSNAGVKSKYTDWYDIVSSDPDIIVLAPCGFDIAKAKKEIFLFKQKPKWEQMRAVRKNRVYYVDGDAYFTRSGPRLVDGIEILARIIHPNLFGSPLEHEAELVV